MGGNLGKEPTKTQEGFVIHINDSNVKYNGKSYDCVEITFAPRLENNPIILLSDDPNYQEIRSAITINKEHKIEYIWSNKYNCYIVTDIMVTLK